MNDTTKSAQAFDARSLMLALGERPLVIYPAYRRLVGGSWSAAAALAQIVYWWTAVGGRRFYKTDAELGQECGLTLEEMKTVKAKLKELSFLTITREGLPAKTWYELDPNEFAAALSAVADNASTEQQQVQEPEETDYGNLKTSFGPRPQTRLGPAHQTNTEMTTENTTSRTTVAEGSLTTPEAEAAATQQAQKSHQHQIERKEKLDRLAAGDEAERRVLGLLARNDREQAILFRELTMPDLGNRRWQRWLQAQIIPEVDRLGDLAAEVVLREAIAAATGAREPRPYIVGILRRAERPRGTTREAVEEELDLDALFGPLEGTNDV